MTAAETSGDAQRVHDEIWAKYLELDAFNRPIVAKRGNLGHGWTFEKRVKANGSGFDRYIWSSSYETFSRGRPRRRPPSRLLS